MVGKPLFERHTDIFWGAWMKDPRAHPQEMDHIWVTNHFTGKSLFIYESFEAFQKDSAFAVYELDEMFYGTGHVAYEGALIYHRSGNSEIVKYDLLRRSIVARFHVPEASFNGRNCLYSTEHSYFDLAVDENGLWLIYKVDDETAAESVRVTKLNAWNLQPERVWDIAVRSQDYGNGFVACGILYLVRDVHSKNTVIDFAYDLYSGERLQSVRLKFTNPFKMNNMLAYNPLEQKIYGWDRGNQITYPILI